MQTPLTIVKVGGAVVEDREKLAQLLRSFCSTEGLKLLVHGGGRRATDIATRLGITTHMIEGRRVTDSDMLQVVTMVYGGLVNKQIVAELQARGVNAVGLTGADMNIIKSHRRPVVNGIDYGFVGDVDRVNAKSLVALLSAGIVPVIAPLTHDSMGTLLNTNADTMAQNVAVALAEHYQVRLVYCFEMAGVMEHPDCIDSVVRHIDENSFQHLKEQGIVSGGMIPKIENALNAIRYGVNDVYITSFSDIEGKNGTHIKNS